MKSLARAGRAFAARVDKTDVAIGAGIGIFSLLLRLLPFFVFGPDPLGYDTGFYRRYLTQPFVSFPNAPVPGLGQDALLPRAFLDTLRLLHLPPDLILYGSYVILCALAPILLFIFLYPKLGRRGSAVAGVLLASSAIAYAGYWYMLFKNAWALDLMLLAFIAFEERWMMGLAVLDIAIALSHETTAIIYMVTLAVLVLFARERRKEVASHLALTAVCFFLVNISFVHEVTVALPTALFLDWPTYAALSIPCAVALIAGIRGLWKRPLPGVLIAFTIASFAFPVLHLPFYERIFLFCDVALIALAAYAIEWLLSKTNLIALDKESFAALAILCLVGGLSLANLRNQIDSLRPLISENDIKAIAQVGSQIPPDATLLTTSDEAPWYEGWTLSHVAAPGLLHDHHDLESWTAFWSATSSAEQTAFLDSFPRPLYISTLGNVSDLIGTPPPCLVPVAPDLLYSECE